MRKSSPLLLISSLLLGTSLSLILTKLLLTHLPIHLISSTIPSSSSQLAFDKSFDLVDFALTGIFSAVIYLLNLLILSFSRLGYKKNFLNQVLFLILSAAIFIQTHFITSSATSVIVCFLISELVLAALSLTLNTQAYQIWFALRGSRSEKTTFDIYSGIFLGFYLLLLSNRLFLLPSLSLLLLFLTPFVYTGLMGLLERKFKIADRVFFPSFLLALGALIPGSLNYLLFLGAIALALSFILRALKIRLDKGFIIRYLYPALAVSLVIYNPLFYVGGFDSVEEGFFLGWLEHLSRGQSLYKDVAVYHPPFLIWGMYLFSKAAGFSIYAERLFLHLLQVGAGVIYFFFLRKVFKNPLITTLIFLFYLGLTVSLVRNNVEIRVGMGLLSLMFLFNFFEGGKRVYLLLAGFFSGVAFMVSLEAGLAVSLTSLVMLLLLSSEAIKVRVKQLGVFVIGMAGVILPVLFYLFINGSLGGFLSQILFYTRAFSQGYFNLRVDRSIVLSYFHFHIFNQYLSSTAFYFELSKLLVFGFLIFYFLKRVSRKLLAQELFICATALFGLFISRATLGRSDPYHLLFSLIISLILLGFALERLASFSKLLGSVLAVVLILSVFGPAINDQFLEASIFKYQTYGQLIGQYQEYDFKRGQGALFDENQNLTDTEQLVSFLQKSTAPSDRIFVYPWNPEIYFFADRLNTTKIDTPYGFFSDKYQEEAISELKLDKNVLVIYNDQMSFGDLSPDSLPILKSAIFKNFKRVKAFGRYQVLQRS